MVGSSLSRRGVSWVESGNAARGRRAFEDTRALSMPSGTEQLPWRRRARMQRCGGWRVWLMSRKHSWTGDEISQAL